MVSRKELQTNYLLISADGQKELATVVRKYYVSYFSLLKDKQDFSDGTMTVSISTLPACSLSCNSCKWDIPWCISDDGHKHKGWNVLGPDRPGSKLTNRQMHLWWSTKIDENDWLVCIQFIFLCHGWLLSMLVGWFTIHSKTLNEWPSVCKRT